MKLITRICLGAVPVFVALGLMGCPPGNAHHQDHPELDGPWQRINPQDAHSFEAEQVHFEEGDDHDHGTVRYFGPFGGPNAMMADKEDDVSAYPVFEGSYVIDASADPHTIDFTWTRYWPDEEEDLSFEAFAQKGIWEAMLDAHGDHSHEILYINFGDDTQYPVDFFDETHGQEIKFERIGGHDDHDHDEHDH